jgi:hypothetical protein
MIRKIAWPDTFREGNPFGGSNGFRSIRITLHSSSFSTISDEEKIALDIIIGLAGLDIVDAMSFDESVLPKIYIDHERSSNEYIGLRIIDAEGETIKFSGVTKSAINPNYISQLLGIYTSGDDEKYQLFRKDILEAKSHGALRRDIFITISDLLLQLRDKLDDINIYTPKEALKIIGLYLRMREEFEWTSHIVGNVRFSTSRQGFYFLLSRGLLPNSWKYISGLYLLNKREDFRSLAWSVITRFSRAMQARDELGRLFYMPKTTSSEDQMAYHFDYLTLLLTAALDVQAIIINEVYGFGLKDINCGFRREIFKRKVKENPATKNLDTLITNNVDFLNILFELRNKIHSVSLETDFYVPKNYPDDLLERIYEYNPEDHWGIQKRSVTLIENNNAPVPSINYYVDTYNLALGLLNEATRLINLIMEETKIENFLDSGCLQKIIRNPPADMIPFIETYMFLA